MEVEIFSHCVFTIYILTQQTYLLYKKSYDLVVSLFMQVSLENILKMLKIKQKFHKFFIILGALTARTIRALTLIPNTLKS